MDIKNLLLESMSSSGVGIRYIRRIRVENNRRYKIRFQIIGKHMYIREIKHIISLASLDERIRRRRKRLFKAPKTFYSAQSEELRDVSTDVFTQTDHKEYCCRFSETDRQEYASREQQTTRKYVRRQQTQTEANTILRTIGNQTQLKKISRSNQTQVYASSMCSQTECAMANNGTQTEEQEQEQRSDEDPPKPVQIETQAAMFMLNEIGEMIIQQNHLLHNNSTLLGQIAEIVMLTKTAQRRETTDKYCRNIARLSKERRLLKIRKGRYRVCHFCVKRFKKSKSDQINQTDLLAISMDAYTQTLSSSSALRFWKGRRCKT